MALNLWKRPRARSQFLENAALDDVDVEAVLNAPPAVESVKPPAKKRDHAGRENKEIKALIKERDAMAKRLTNLQRMLADPAGGQNAILYYRLRGIWKLCSSNLELMAKRFIEKYEAESKAQGNAKLPVDKRRAINILLIAIAQEYYLLFAEDQLADMSRKAMLKSVETVNFGMAEECLEFQRKAFELTVRARNEKKFSNALNWRAKYLNDTLRFDEGACLPRESSLNIMPSRVSKDKNALNNFSDSVRVNVLACNYWNLKAVLLG